MASLFRAHNWHEATLILCRAWDASGFVDLWTGHGVAERTAVVDLSGLDRAELPRYLRRHLEEYRELPGPAVLFGCSPRLSRLVFRTAKELGVTQEFHWVLGEPQNVAALQTDGLPFGLLAFGEVERPSLEQLVQDAAELVARAIACAVQVRPDLALIQNMVNCNDKHTFGAESSGRYLSR